MTFKTVSLIFPFWRFFFLSSSILYPLLDIINILTSNSIHVGSPFFTSANGSLLPDNPKRREFPLFFLSPHAHKTIPRESFPPPFLGWYNSVSFINTAIAKQLLSKGNQKPLFGVWSCVCVCFFPLFTMMFYRPSVVYVFLQVAWHVKGVQGRAPFYYIVLVRS